jgi:hypothetical protein
MLGLAFDLSSSRRAQAEGGQPNGPTKDPWRHLSLSDDKKCRFLNFLKEAKSEESP